MDQMGRIYYHKGEGIEGERKVGNEAGKEKK